MKKLLIKIITASVLLSAWLFWDITQAGMEAILSFPTFKPVAEFDAVSEATAKVAIVRSDDPELAHPTPPDDANISYQTIEKYYYALVWGTFADDRGEIDAPIGRSPRNRKKFTVIDSGRPSLSRYEVLERFEFLTLVRVKLETGRTHQIRVHMTHVNHPLFGDPYYGGRNTKIITLNMRNRKLAARLLELLNRQALHARRLVLKHPLSGETLDLKAPLHADFEAVLEILRAESAF
jgi:23S rRNA pseudouridine1911/1915/1917 synthase